MNEYDIGQIWEWDNREIYLLLERFKVTTFYNKHYEHWYAIRLNDALYTTITIHSETHLSNAYWKQL